MSSKLAYFGIWFFVCHIFLRLRMFCQSLSMALLSLDYTDNIDSALYFEP